MAAMTAPLAPPDQRHCKLVGVWTKELEYAAANWNEMDWACKVDFDFEWFGANLPRLAIVRAESEAGLLGPADRAALAAFENLLVQHAAFLAEVAEGN